MRSNKLQNEMFSAYYNYSYSGDDPIKREPPSLDKDKQLPINKKHTAKKRRARGFYQQTQNISTIVAFFEIV